MNAAVIGLLGIALGAVLAALVFLLLRRAKNAPTTVTTAAVAEKVRSVGKLVGLEVNVKEIATSSKGWSWLPPLLLSQARLAMIFHFEKQYAVDLSRVRAADVVPTGETPDGRPRFTVRLPPVEGVLRLTDLEPYDIQAGRVLGLLDVIQINAATQRELMRRAQEQAAGLYQVNDERYRNEARESLERQLRALLALFGVEAEVEWAPAKEGARTDRLAEEPVVATR